MFKQLRVVLLSAMIAVVSSSPLVSSTKRPRGNVPFPGKKPAPGFEGKMLFSDEFEGYLPTPVKVTNGALVLTAEKQMLPASRLGGEIVGILAGSEAQSEPICFFVTVANGGNYRRNSDGITAFLATFKIEHIRIRGNN